MLRQNAHCHHSKGFGYWDLTRHPKGGDFSRLTEDAILTVDTEHGEACTVTFLMANASASLERPAFQKGSIDGLADN
jgi:hypothetical protein